MVVNPKTRMNPNLEYSQAIPGSDTGRPEGVLDGRVLIRAHSRDGVSGRNRLVGCKGTGRYAQMVRGLPSLADAQQNRGGRKEIAATITPRGTWRNWRRWLNSVSDNAAQQSAFALYRDHLSQQIRKDWKRSARRGAHAVALLLGLVTWKPSRWCAASRRYREWICGLCRRKTAPPLAPSSIIWPPI